MRDAMRELPALIRDVAKQADNGSFEIKLRDTERELLEAKYRAESRQRFWLTLAATGIVSGTLVLVLGQWPLLAYGMLAAGVVGGYFGRR